MKQLLVLGVTAVAILAVGASQVGHESIRVEQFPPTPNSECHEPSAVIKANMGPDAGLYQCLWDKWTKLASMKDLASYETVAAHNESLAAFLISPAFSGTPTAPTAAPGTNTTQLATTAFVTTAVASMASGMVTRYQCTGTDGSCYPAMLTQPYKDVIGHVQLHAGAATVTGLPALTYGVAQCYCADGNTACTANLTSATTVAVNGKDGDFVQYHCIQ